MGKAKPQPLTGPLPITIERAANLCSVTEKTIRSWIMNGLDVMHAGRQGSKTDRTIIDLVVLLRWYLEQDALDVAKTRLASAQADRHEIENATRRGELLSVEDVERAWTDLILACRSKILGLPTKLAARLINVSDAATIAALIGEEVTATLDELAALDQVGSGRSQRAGARRPAAVATAAKTNGERMGRRKAKAEQRILS
jgi:phage terminase Nu1 subunit (DNA packaging protein)